MTSQASLSLSLYYSQKSLTHNIGSASALPIIHVTRFLPKGGRPVSIIVFYGTSSTYHGAQHGNLVIFLYMQEKPEWITVPNPNDICMLSTIPALARIQSEWCVGHLLRERLPRIHRIDPRRRAIRIGKWIKKILPDRTNGIFLTKSGLDAQCKRLTKCS